MHKALFLLCPTDCLEPIVNSTFKQENFFYTSLGNSFSLDRKTLEYIKELIIEHRIINIYFALSNDNQIIMDALEGQSFSNIRGLKAFYDVIKKQKEYSEISWQGNKEFTILSYYMNKRINEFQNFLNFLLNPSIKIHGKIYNREKDLFSNIHSDLICLDKSHLN